ncbi:hypothetical protein NQ318_009373 [Aromia moschata]|uniref:Uncharacterized protein n=1 Tax=Aromia moschata TaxID=1265417 RepID=A0AAV8XDV5_9CUCU|nr:hypothetical protein NQ318_009373 [Aromia moschata]
MAAKAEGSRRPENAADTKADTEADSNTEAVPSVGNAEPQAEPEAKVDTKEAMSSSQHSDIKQPIIKLNRLSEEDQLLLQKSLKELVRTKSKLREESWY